MTFKQLVFFIAALLTQATGPVLAADRVILNNGDRLTGTIVASDGKSMTMTTPFLGEVKIQWEAIREIVSDQRLFVTDSQGQVLVGTVSTQQEHLQVQTSRGGPVPISKADVQAVRSKAAQVAYQAEIERLRNPGLLDFWSGYLDTGLSITQGNAETSTYSTSAKANRKTQRDKISLYLTSLFARNDTSGVSLTTANAIRGGSRYDISLSDRLFTFGFIDLEFDEFQNLDLRNVLGGGLGWHVKKTNRLLFDVFGGGAFNQEFFSNDLTRRSGELVLGEEFSYQLSGVSSFDQRMSFYPNLTETGEYRVQFDASLVTKLNKWLAWHLTLSDRFLSNPIPGVVKNDVLLTTGARLSFGAVE